VAICDSHGTKGEGFGHEAQGQGRHRHRHQPQYRRRHRRGAGGQGAAIVAVDANAANAKDCAGYINGTQRRAIAVTCDVTDAVNRAPEFMMSKQLIAERARVDAAKLADPRVALKEVRP
jgi:hypothetical protein